MSHQFPLQQSVKMDNFMGNDTAGMKMQHLNNGRRQNPHDVQRKDNQNLSNIRDFDLGGGGDPNDQANFQLSTQVGKLIHQQLQQSLQQYLEEFNSNGNMLDGSKLQDQIENQVFQSEQFLQMQEKMSSYFNEKSQENAFKGKQLLNQMDQLLTDMRGLNESIQTQNKKAKTAKQNLKKNGQTDQKDDESGIVDITEALRSYKLRSEIERAFFFHLFYEILRQQFGLKGTPKEKDIFERKGSQVDISTIITSKDIRSVIEGREAYERASEEQKKKWLRQREQRIVYHANAHHNNENQDTNPKKVQIKAKDNYTDDEADQQEENKGNQNRNQRGPSNAIQRVNDTAAIDKRSTSFMDSFNQTAGKNNNYSNVNSSMFNGFGMNSNCSSMKQMFQSSVKPNISSTKMGNFNESYCSMNNNFMRDQMPSSNPLVKFM
ncbi:UNKNOWN [Stylonychia lemnae]|uniref:Uncharacterized protein n=1 Tax=Stylonychia lemnae TaxID=5949 RepID=A0A078B4U0_STYLE|nr:UNKNOWN [Stylonychia lemnae]|eukprot:CDW89276.1 UNKNOWN [Stylonychia lemnae]